MKFIVEHQSSRGPVRQNNEDTLDFSLEPLADFCWLLIADGMGGHQAGEVASQMLVEQVKEAMTSLQGHYAQSWTEWIKSTLAAANLAIFETANGSADKRGMGTTGVLLVYYQGEMVVGWVGDSRAYLYRDEQLQALTRDHSAVHYLLDKGSITQKEADNSDSKHLLARAIGSKQTVEVDCVSLAAKSGDVLLLSTDGLHDYIPEAILTRYLNQFAAGKKVTENLVNLSIAQGSQDNISLLLAKLI